MITIVQRLTKAAYNAQMTDKIAKGDQKLTQVASNALNNLGY